MHCMKKVTDLIIEPRRTYQSSYRIQLSLLDISSMRPTV